MNAKTGEYNQGSHGGEIYQVAHRLKCAPEQIIDFSTNVNILAYEHTRALVSESFYPFVSYPDSSCNALREIIKTHEGMDKDNIFCSNGGTALIWKILQATTPRKVIMLGPMFSEYAKACTALNIEYKVIETNPDEAFACSDNILRSLRQEKADLFIICTPNNPACITYENIQTIMHSIHAPNILVDTSYREFLYGSPDYDELSWQSLNKHLPSHVHLITLNSLTKFFCCPGMRIGYVVSSKEIVRKLSLKEPAWSVDQFSQNLGVGFFQNIDIYRTTIPQTEVLLQEFNFNLRKTKMFEEDLIFNGPNFLCCGLKKNRDGLSSAILQNELLHFGILIRNCDNIPGMPKNFIRIQVRFARENAILADILSKINSAIA